MFRQGRLIAGAILVIGLSGVGAGCGGDDDEPAERAADKPKTETTAKPVDIDKDPYKITCADMADPLAAARLTRRATNTLAIEAKIAGMSQLQAATSIFTAMTELCKKNGPGYTPAKAAVAEVKKGRYEADLGTP